MKAQDQVVSLIGAINLLSELRDELYAKELHGAGDEIVRAQATLRRQLHTLIEEAHVNRVVLELPPLRSVAGVG